MIMIMIIQDFIEFIAMSKKVHTLLTNFPSNRWRD